VGGDYNPWTPPLGGYTLVGTPYTGAGAAGTAGTALTLNFSVINQATRTAASGAATREVNNLPAASVGAYPNPSGTGRFRLELPAAFQGEVHYTLLSSLGVKLKAGQVLLPAGRTGLEMDFGSQMRQEGVYYLHLSGGKATAHLTLLRR
jgi:hypothetical protein